MSKFNELGLSPQIVKAVDEMGYLEPTQIQMEAIPALLSSRDVLGRSNTGTGKTAAFGLPAIEKVDPQNRNPQILILSPTRELDIQIATEMRKFSKYKEGVKIVPIYGGESIENQIKLLKRGCNIVVGTPGRVMDHLRRKTLKLQDIRMVVLDEADEMLNMGFKEDIETIWAYMEQKYQMALFSATMPQAILKLTQQFQTDPISIEVKSAQRTIDTVEQVYYECKRGRKSDALRILLNALNPELTMIFCNTKKMVEELVDELNTYDIKAIGLHGDMKQQFRTRVMEQYKAKNYPILIATDVAARGIDVDDIDLVVNYDIPQDFEYYIHRVGRTGRAGKKGKAVTLVSGKSQLKFMKEISKYTKTIIPSRPLPTSEQLEEKNRLLYIEEVKRACSEGIDDHSIEIANMLLSEGIAIENLLSGLISMSYKPVNIDVASVSDGSRKERHFDVGETTTLHFNVGKNQKIAASNIVAAIAQYTQLSSSIIGRIELKPRYTLVDIQNEYVDVVLQKMMVCMIKGYEVNVKIDAMDTAKTDHRKFSERSMDEKKKRHESAKVNSRRMRNRKAVKTETKPARRTRSDR